MRTAIYPGTFDPITNGHLDIIQRTARLFDRLIVGVAANPGKSPLFSLEERVSLIDDELKPMHDHGLDIEVHAFDNLLMEFATQHGALAIVRGIRAVSDYEYELQMAGMNARINPKVETIFLTAAEGQHFVASSLVKEVARLGGDVSNFVNPKINQALMQRFGIEKALEF